MSKTKTENKSPTPPRTKTKSTGTGSTTKTLQEELQQELDKLEAVCQSLRAALDEEQDVGDYSPDTIRRWKQQDMEDEDLLIVYNVEMYSNTRRLARVHGTSDLRGILARDAVPEAPERFGFQFTGQVWQPIRLRFEQLINGLHDHTSVSAQSQYSLDGQSRISSSMQDPGAVSEPPAVRGALPGTVDD